ncbi:MAG TPA: hypothetical protein VKR31_13285 [Rhizomicrobium sp.]|nr:hypothetical protein [Rhizomicrobium sp.]
MTRFLRDQRHEHEAQFAVIEQPAVTPAMVSVAAMMVIVTLMVVVTLTVAAAMMVTVVFAGRVVMVAVRTPVGTAMAAMAAGACVSHAA